MKDDTSEIVLWLLYFGKIIDGKHAVFGEEVNNLNEFIQFSYNWDET